MLAGEKAFIRKLLEMLLDFSAVTRVLIEGGVEKNKILTINKFEYEIVSMLIEMLEKE